MGYIPYTGLFLLINTFIKVIPIVSLIGTPIKKIDIQAGFIYLFTWIAWMFINKESVLKTRTPLMMILN